MRNLNVIEIQYGDAILAWSDLSGFRENTKQSCKLNSMHIELNYRETFSSTDVNKGLKWDYA